MPFELKPDDVFLRVNTETCLYPLDAESSSFVETVAYDVLHCMDPDDTILGEVLVYDVKLGAADEAGVPWSQVMGEESADLEDIHDLMIDPVTGELDADFEDAVGTAWGTDLWYVPTDEIVDAPWGLAALRILAQHSLASTAYLVVGVTGLAAPDSEDEFNRALTRAAKLHLLGFERVGNSPFLFLNQDYRVNPLPAQGDLKMLDILEEIAFLDEAAAYARLQEHDAFIRQWFSKERA
jgi:hypothetical protein